MSANIKAQPWNRRSALHLILAPVARLLKRARSKRPLPYDWREIEHARMELELRRAQVPINIRFKVM